MSERLTVEQIEEWREWYNGDNQQITMNGFSRLCDAALRGIQRPDLEAAADDIRQQGWMVAVHNDYTLNGLRYTFWLFTRDGRCVRGEGSTDAEALNEVRRELRALATGPAAQGDGVERRVKERRGTATATAQREFLQYSPIDRRRISNQSDRRAGAKVGEHR